MVTAVALAAWYYGYPELVREPPQSIHHWRQSDCASLTLNYYQQDLPFWQPKTHGLVSDYGTTAYNAPSEIPIYYWGIGQLYRVFGPRPALLRGFNTLLFLIGIIAFAHTLFLVSKNLLWSILLGMLLFTSPILVYYGNNFLTNAPAFGMALCGLSALVVFFQTQKTKHWWAAIFFLLAGSLKLPGLFLFFAFGAMALFHPGALPGLARKKLFMAGAIVLLPLAAWVGYAAYFNHLHHTTYFSTTTFPLWHYSGADLSFIVHEIYRAWWGAHFHPYTCLALGLLLLFLFIKWKKMHRPFRIALLYLLAGMLIFVVLQFFTFMQHDYYTINMFILVALMLVVFSQYLYRYHPKWIGNPLVLTLLAVVLGANMHYARQQLEFRYQGWPNQFRQEQPELYGPATKTWLEQVGVGREDTVIFIADDSHTSLYLLNRFGWTTHKMVFKDTSQTIRFNRSRAGMERSLANGAEYLLVHGVQTLYNRTYIQPFLKHLSGRKGDLFVFNLKKSERNFTLPTPRVARSFYFDFENGEDSLFAPMAKWAEDFTRPGNTVLKAWPEDEYLGLWPLDSLAENMSIEVRVWVNTHPDAKVVPVIASMEPGLAFAQAQQILKERGRWRLLRQQLRVSQAMEARGARIFMWNPGGEEAIFDSLEVRVLERNALY